jgi:hypothetical protein
VTLDTVCRLKAAVPDEMAGSGKLAPVNACSIRVSLRADAEIFPGISGLLCRY